jgi:hypothetical protein
MEKPEKHQLTPAERIFVRISVLQTALAVIGIFTGAVALYAALNESDSASKQLYASVWPHIETGSDRFTKEAVARRDEFHGIEGPLFRFTVLNSGIGPARIASVQVIVDDKPQLSWAQALESLIGPINTTFGSSTLGGRVIRAGETVYPLTLMGEPAQRLEDALSGSADRSQRIAMRICYCSVFDQCWLKEDQAAREDAARGEPRSVEKCPDFGKDEFLE